MRNQFVPRLLFVLGFGVLGLMTFFGWRWEGSEFYGRIAFVAAVITAAIAVGLDIRDRRRNGGADRPVS